MGTFDFSVAKNANQVTSTFLRGGIHNVIYKGLEWVPAQGEGNSDAFALLFETKDGISHRETIFDPSTRTNCTQRTTTQYGENPSDIENFMVKITQIITALNPELGAKIAAGEKIEISSFKSLAKYVKENLANSIGKETQIKLVPYKGFANFPNFVASVSKDGVVRSKTKIIGDNLTLTAKEKTDIENANSAQPTNMRERSKELDDLKENFPDVKGSEDDLPF